MALLTSGQTGVERGVSQMAQAHGVPIGGFMTAQGRDELGPVPLDLAGGLWACTRRGARVAQIVNVELASTVVVAVPKATAAAQFTAMKQVLQLARAWHIPLVVCDPATDLEQIATKILAFPQQIYITGPRATRWSDGASLGRRIVLALLLGRHAH